MTETELARLRRRKVGFVFQFFNLVPTPSAVENVELPLLLVGRRQRGATDGERADERSASSTSTELLRCTCQAGSSSGSRWRALANRPDVVLADEPTGNLDSAAAREVLGLFRDARGRGQTLVLVTHDASVAASADRVTLRDGLVANETELGAARQVPPLLELESPA